MAYYEPHGDEYVTSDQEHPCSVCGTSTDRIELCFEAPYCSQECVSIETDRYFEALANPPGWMEQQPWFNRPTRSS